MTNEKKRIKPSDFDCLSTKIENDENILSPVKPHGYSYLGIDTSNYTTSVSAINFPLNFAEIYGKNRKIPEEYIHNLRKIIDIKEGERGIRQSDGVFIHLKTLPALFEGLEIDMKSVRAIGVSTKPRNQSGSYMPVFTAGESFAHIIAKALCIPLFEYSHQDGHLMAGILSGGFFELLENPFTAVHLSGGTTEILSCRYNGKFFDVQIIGGTEDISAGQLIDRLGVKMGIKFPCGKEIDALSCEADTVIPLKTCVRNGFMNLSGMETKLLSMVGIENPTVLAKSALLFLAKSITQAVNNTCPKRVLFVGGVSSNSFLRDYFRENISAQVYFASLALSTDNAVGIAELCRRECE